MNIFKPYQTFSPVSKEEDNIGRAIVNAAYKVHQELGPGLLEKVYEECFQYVLEKEGYEIERQVLVPIVFEEIIISGGLRLDILVNNKVICELKSISEVQAVHEAQLLSYLRLSEKRLGYLINFNVPLIKNGIKRMIL